MLVGIYNQSIIKQTKIWLLACHPALAIVNINSNTHFSPPEQPILLPSWEHHWEMEAPTLPLKMQHPAHPSGPHWTAVFLCVTLPGQSSSSFLSPSPPLPAGSGCLEAQPFLTASS